MQWWMSSSVGSGDQATADERSVAHDLARGQCPHPHPDHERRRPVERTGQAAHRRVAGGMRSCRFGSGSPSGRHHQLRSRVLLWRAPRRSFGEAVVGLPPCWPCAGHGRALWGLPSFRQTVPGTYRGALSGRWNGLAAALDITVPAQAARGPSPERAGPGPLGMAQARPWPGVERRAGGADCPIHVGLAVPPICLRCRAGRYEPAVPAARRLPPGTSSGVPAFARFLDGRQRSRTCGRLLLGRVEEHG